MSLTVGSLFSGIGGFDLGLERAGMQVKWQCEQDDYCRRVLAKHWPDVPCYEDVRALRAGDVESVDLLCGGFPCQDLSVAGRAAGLDGSRSGLWSEFARLIGELRPRYVIVENVPMLRSRGLGRVLGEMAALGYDAEWDCVPAKAVGAHHRRDRIWIVAYPQRVGRAGWPRLGGSGHLDWEASQWGEGSGEPFGRSEAGADCVRRHRKAWAVEPDVGRVADGVPARMDRLRALGNALVPQVAELVARRIVAYEGMIA